MKCGLVFLFALWMFGSPAGTQALAQEVETVLDVPVVSKYVWRGLICTDETVLQPSLDVSRKGFGINVWTSLDATDINENDKEFNEIDLTLYYARTCKKFDTAIGYVNYTYPNTAAAATSEFFVSVTMDLIGSPSLTYFLDTEEIEGGYVSIGGGHSIPMGVNGPRPWSIDLSANLGYGSKAYNVGYFGITDAGLVDLLLSATAPIEVDGHLSITPQVFYMMLMNDDIKDLPDTEDSVVFFGLSASWAY